MSTATDLIDDLTTAGVTLEAHGDKLRFHPRDQVTNGQLGQLSQHKAELLAILTTTVRCPWCRSTSLADDPHGIRCEQCGHLAWQLIPGGGVVRADCANDRMTNTSSRSIKPVL